MKKLFLTAIMALACTMAFCQTADEPAPVSMQGSHLYLGVRGGASGMLFNSDMDLTSTPQVNLGLDINYAYFFGKHFGLRTGINFVSFTCKSQQQVDNDFEGNDAYIYTVNSTDAYGNNYTQIGVEEYVSRFHATGTVDEYFGGYNFEIPLQLAFQSEHWYANLGVKFAIPGYLFSSNKSKLDIDYLGAVQADGTLFPDLTSDPMRITEKTNSVEGNTTYYAIGGNYGKHYPFQVLGAFDFGYRFGCTCGNSWMIGLYADFAIKGVDLLAQNEVSAAGTTNMGINIDIPTETYEVTYNSGILTSPLANSFRLFDFGVKIQYDFGLSKRN